MTAPRHERPEILARIPRSGHVVLEASAGTGKTWTLERLVADLLLTSEPPLSLEQILVVTFTEKATGELRARLRGFLETLLGRREGDGRDAPAGRDAWVLDVAARERLTAAIESFDAATISTIHGFCQRILREHAFGAGRLPDQEVRDGRSLFGEAFREVLREALAEGDPQREGLLELLAAKSATEVEKQLWEIHDTRGSTVTPTGDPRRLRDVARRLAALPSDLPERLGELIRRELDTRSDGKVGALLDCARQVANGAAPAEELAAAFLAWARGGLASKVDSRKRLEKMLGLLDGKIDDDLGSFAAALIDLQTHARPADFLVHLALVDRVRARIARRKQREGVLDYDDMLTQLKEAVVRRPDLVDTVRGRFRVALVDEFQDTDPVQWEIFRRIFWEPGPDGHRLVVVGDPKQAIYAFRGADVFTYLDVRGEVESGRGTVVPLATCWRSTPRLVEALNDLFGGAAEGPFPASGISYPEARCGREGASFEAPGPEEAVHLMTVAGAPQADPLRSGIAAWIAAETARLLAGSEAIDPGAVSPAPKRRSLKASDIMLLVGSHGEAAIALDALRRRGIPAVRIADRGVFATAEADHLIRILRAVADPDDRSARLQALLTPCLGVPLEDLPAARELGDDHPHAHRLAAWHELAADRRYGDLFRDVLHGTGLARRLSYLADGSRELVNYHHVIDLLLAEAAASPADPTELVRRAEAARRRHVELGTLLPPEERERPADPDAVRVLTIHAAKGLEAEVVFLAAAFSTTPSGVSHRYHVERPDGTHERRFHLGKPLGTIAELVDREAEGEAERLIYVAATRARSRLYLPWIPDQPSPCGAYRALHRILARRTEGALPATLARRDVPIPSEADPETSRAARALEGWTPPSLPPDDAPPADLAHLRQERRGPILTSYTRLHRQEEVTAETGATPTLVGPAEAAPAVDADDLPGGRGVGILLHAVLEEADPTFALAAPDVTAWEADERIARLLDRQLRLHALAEEHRPRIRDLAWSGLRTPVSLPGLALPGGFAQPARRRREMEFLFPLPEEGHPDLAAPLDPDEPRPFRARDGFVQGVIDLLFEHEGRFWVLDWKSDRLPDTSREAIAARVEERYGLQVRLYALAAARMLRLGSAAEVAARFGGVLYVFLRAFGPGGRGLHHVPVAWDELSAWERELVGRVAS